MLPLEKGGSELGPRPALDPSTSISSTKATYTLSANGDLEAKYTYDAHRLVRRRAEGELRSAQGRALDRYFQQQAAGSSAAAVDKGHRQRHASVTGAFTVTHDVAMPGYSQAQANVPRVRAAAGGARRRDDEPSTQPVDAQAAAVVGLPRTERGEISVQIPAGWKVAYVPPKLEGAAEALQYSSECTAAGQTVTCKGEIKLDKLVVPTDKYPAFRDAMTKLQAYERRVVLLVKA